MTITDSFEENYVHEDAYAMSSSHFGKTQTTLLVAVVYYVNNGEIVKVYYDFVSEYLGHNSVFYDKSMGILIEELQASLHFSIDTVYIVSDGGNHFVSRFSFWTLGEYSRYYGIF
jgi:hypothetical protein